MWSVATPSVILLRKISPRDSLLICSSVHSINICEVTLCSMHCINGSLNQNVRCYLHTSSILWMITHIPACHLWHWLLLRLSVILQCAKLPQSCPTLCNLMDCSPSGSLSMGFSRQETGVGCHFLLQDTFLTQELILHLLFPALSGRFFTTSATWEANCLNVTCK